MIPGQPWEYLVERRPLTPRNLPAAPGEQAYLLSQGVAGWELVAILHVTGTEPFSTEAVFYWKRPVP